MFFFISCVYGDPVEARWQIVWDRLVNIGLQRDYPWLLAEDFNELMSNDDKLDGAVSEESSFWGFRNMARSFIIKELRSFGSKISWGRVRDKI